MFLEDMEPNISTQDYQQLPKLEPRHLLGIVTEIFKRETESSPWLSGIFGMLIISKKKDVKPLSINRLLLGHRTDSVSIKTCKLGFI